MNPSTCDVCSQPIGMRWYHNELGRTWCDRHTRWPDCAWCGMPTREKRHGEYACRLCVTDIVTTEQQAQPVIRRVATAMSAEGVGLSMDFTVILDERRALMRRGLFDNDATRAVTQVSWQGSRSQVTKVTVALTTGMPKLQFTSTFAHEFGHMYLAGAPKTGPQWIEEGFCEVLSYTYLTRHDRTPAALRYADIRYQSPDPVYGEGLRRVLAAVRQRGLPAVAHALREGRPRDAGLPR